MYVQYYANEIEHCCPGDQVECKGRNIPWSVIPVIYGFPSPEILEAKNGGKLVFGADHIPVSQWELPTWGCRICKSVWKKYPWL